MIGLSDDTGHVILRPECRKIEVHKGELVLYRTNTFWGALDLDGNKILNEEWAEFSFFNDNFIRLVDTARVVALYSYTFPGVIGRGQYDAFLPFSETMSLTRKDGALGLLDAEGREVLPSRL